MDGREKSYVDGNRSRLKKKELGEEGTSSQSTTSFDLRHVSTKTIEREREQKMETNTKRTKTTILPVELHKLLEVSKEEDRFLLSELQDPYFGFKELIKVGKYSNEMLETVVYVLSKVAGCTSCPQNVMDLLNDVLTSNFFVVDVPKYLEATPQDPLEFDRLKTILEGLVKLFDKLLQCFPNKAAETLGIAFVTMKDVAKRFEKLEMPLDQRLTEKIADLDQLRSEYLSKYNAVTRKKLTRTEAESFQTPPTDFRFMSIFPTIADIHEIFDPFLRANVITGKYNDVDHYLDVHFRLMREDFVAPLRDGLTQYRAMVQCGKAKEMNQKDIKIYFDVRIVSTECSPNEGVLYRLSFDVARLKYVRWENTRRLMYGSLVCISSDDFQTFTLGVIVNQDPELLRNGQLTVRFVGAQSVIVIDLKRVYVMAESPAYFEAYSPILRGLQSMNEWSLPFAQYLINAATNLNAPRYLIQTSVYDFKPLMKSCSVRSVVPRQVVYPRQWLNFTANDIFHILRDYLNPSRPCQILDDSSWPTAEELDLDDNQHAALKLCLTKEVAIVQGPPGTGKTFLGLKVVDMLLHNEQPKDSPILVVCYTNHALDQFLEGILRFEGNIVRIGGRSKSESMEGHNLNSLRKTYGRFSQKVYRIRKLLYERLTLFSRQIADQMWALREAEVRILHEDMLQPFMKRAHFSQLHYTTYVRDSSVILDWFGLSVAVEETPYEDKTTFNEYDDDQESVVEDVLARDEMDRRFSDRYFKEDSYFQPFVHLSVRSFGVHNLRDAQLPDEQGGWQVVGRSQTIKRQVQREMKSSHLMTDEEENGIHDVWTLSLPDRWRLYRLWVSRLRHERLTSVHKKQESYETTYQQLKKVVHLMDVSIVQKAKVVGMTTTGAAKYRDLLQKVAPRIVVVEEAAEVLESHIITALTHRCNHLIMIGDQQQLRPNPTVYKLARNYNLDVSLFERLIRNKMPYERLQIQHRMRPRIAELLVPHIYKTLVNHPSVEEYDSVKGTVSSVYFVNHTHIENTVDDTSSRANGFEANFLIALCCHLLLQGYKSDQITILSTYLGQVFLIKKLIKSTIGRDVRCTVVDNFQGEENDIILLSLVRSNEKGNVGFLKVDNRVCVALSRAKIGLFCVGNFDFLAENAKIWKPIVDSLRKDNLIGPRLELKCENHPEFITAVSCSSDFNKLSSDGGCGLPCDYRLSCGHRCPKVCHFYDKEHEEIQCTKPCEKVVCKLGHKCTQLCHVECKKCLFIVSKENPICGHVNDIECHENPSTVPCMKPCEKVSCELKHKCKLRCHGKVKCGSCLVIVSKKNPRCGHFNDMPCFKNPSAVPCMKPCEKVLCELQHKCTQLCHVKCNRCLVVLPKKNPICGHVNEMACGELPHAVPCKKPCEKILCKLQHKCTRLCYMKCGDCMVILPKPNPICGHVIDIPCHELPLNVPCKKVLYDLEHKCTQLCHVKCNDCLVILLKENPICGHVNEMACHEDPLTVPCKKPCEKFLNCGHRCMKDCGEVCDDESCDIAVERVAADCGHDVFVACSRSNDEKSCLNACRYPCLELLSCGHLCAGNCGECHQGRMHIRCKEKCSRPRLCGHACKVQCFRKCLPCSQLCENQCVHAKCNLHCVFTCKPCKEPCAWRCKHLSCTKLCHEPCDRDPCNESCPINLECGHQCIGFCGEPCPKQCRDCNREEVCEILFGTEDEEDARFVLLEDCGHVIESTAMDFYMKQVTRVTNDSSHTVIEMKRCPKCATVIRKTLRYSAIVNQIHEDVSVVKSKIHEYMLAKKVQWKQNVLKGRVNTVVETCKGTLSKLRDCTTKLHKEGQGCRNLLDVIKVEILLSLLEEMIQHFKVVVQNSNFSSVEEKLNELQDLFLELNRNSSNEQLYEFSREFQRVLLLSSLLQSVDRNALDDPAKVSYDTIVSDLTDRTPFSELLEEEVRRKLTELKELQVDLEISEVSKRKPMTVFDMNQGYWFKCSNGHIYGISEYEWDVQEGRCMECEAVVGRGRRRRFQGTLTWCSNNP